MVGLKPLAFFLVSFLQDAQDTNPIQQIPFWGGGLTSKICMDLLVLLDECIRYVFTAILSMDDAVVFVKIRSQGMCRIRGKIASRDQMLPWSFSSSFLSSMFLLIHQASTTQFSASPWKSISIHTRVALEQPHLPPTSFQLKIQVPKLVQN